MDIRAHQRDIRLQWKGKGKKKQSGRQQSIPNLSCRKGEGENGMFMEK